MKLGDISTKSVFYVEPQDPVQRAFKIMQKHGIHHLPVLDSGRVVGMVSDRDLLITGVGADDGKQTSSRKRSANLPLVSQIMSQPVRTLSPDDPLRSATWLMVKYRIHAIALVRDERLVGLVTESDLLRSMIGSQTYSQLHDKAFLRQSVSSHMQVNLTTVGPKTSLYDVVDIMCRQKIRHLPVVVDQMLIGIVSDRDVRQALGRAGVLDAQSQESGQMYLVPTEVFDFMSQSINTISSSTTIQAAADELLGLKIHCLPVVDDGNLVGLLTDTDLIRLIGAIDKQDSVQQLSE